MSKRYGRNQKRAHRTRIAALEAEVSLLKRNNGTLWRANKELSDEIETAKQIVGPFCIAFDPQTRHLHMKHEHMLTIRQVECNTGIGVSRYWDHSHNPMHDMHRINEIRLPIICALAAEDIRLARHFNVAYDGKVYGYAIDLMAFKFARFPSRLLNDIGIRIADLILKENLKDFDHVEPKRHTRDELEPRISAPRFEFPGLPDFLKGN
jgi:hypothetical protein